MEKVSSLAAMTALQMASGTHEGMVGKNNEDSLGSSTWQAGNKTVHLGIVADGVGGQTAGETASLMAVEIIEQHFANMVQLNESELLKHMEQAVLEANQQVYTRALNEEELQGMATTVVVAAVMDNRLYTSHVGDSRIYLWRDGELHQLTLDHSWVQEAVSAGLLTAEQARHHPNKNVIRRSLGGMASVAVDQRPLSSPIFKASQGLALLPNDTILLCSDGLSDMIEDWEICESLEAHRNNLQQATDNLIDRANDAGGRDNISVILMHIPETSQPKSAVTIASQAQNNASNPRVVSAPLNRNQKEAQARRRRIWLSAIVVLTVLVVLLVVYLQLPASPPPTP